MTEACKVRADALIPTYRQFLNGSSTPIQEMTIFFAIGGHFYYISACLTFLIENKAPTTPNKHSTGANSGCAPNEVRKAIVIITAVTKVEGTEYLSKPTT